MLWCNHKTRHYFLRIHNSVLPSIRHSITYSVEKLPLLKLKSKQTEATVGMSNNEVSAAGLYQCLLKGPSAFKQPLGPSSTTSMDYVRLLRSDSKLTFETLNLLSIWYGSSDMASVHQRKTRICDHKVWAVHEGQLFGVLTFVSVASFSEQTTFVLPSFFYRA
jgi:hypothetical protein